ncbi:hypothetical protein SDRG_06282 [Saprolegnia diclina VS20]|uniref:Uncharacterized protein n=1 Tax=Saprolegnia diclina (strain VS20) TaxID=1156394 RepID=T0QE42_SAPDV|nr:hypothetical protein SDRG_06282 [Saprolegnia diclina VS20]EQC36169.1 hypothetical protein SDRG_06282 [Saprolegnia diclina VS20]|eukprot:XP_008610275.1 hypothetical protein SDRG_06282 [Saprolegnia diclina VS20]
MSFNLAHDRDILNNMTYYEVLKLAKMHHVQSTKYRMSKAYMINALLGMDPKNNVDRLDCEDKLAATHDFRIVRNEVEEYIFQHDLGSSDVLLISWNEASISHIAQALKVMTNAVPHWCSLKTMDRVTHQQLLDDLMAYLCFGIERVGRVMMTNCAPELVDHAETRRRDSDASMTILPNHGDGQTNAAAEDYVVASRHDADTLFFVASALSYKMKELWVMDLTGVRNAAHSGGHEYARCQPKCYLMDKRSDCVHREYLCYDSCHRTVHNRAMFKTYHVNMARLCTVRWHES